MYWTGAFFLCSVRSLIKNAVFYDNNSSYVGFPNQVTSHPWTEPQIGMGQAGIFSDRAEPERNWFEST